jgi:hypothetical protein
MRVLELPHVCAHVVDGRPVVDIDDDAELFDFVEDELIERFDLEYEHLCPLKATGQVRLVYAPTTSIEAIFEALRSIGPAELERIFRLNNPGTSGP